VRELTARRPRKEFDPTPHRRELVAIIDEIVAQSDLDSRAINQILKKYPRGGTGFFSRSEIIAGFRRFGSTTAPDPNAKRCHTCHGAHKTVPVPGQVHFLSKRRSHAKELSIRRARRAAG